jgi:hypothetical protein
VVIACLSAAASACSNGDGNDAAVARDADGPEDADGGVIEDADASDGPEDTGVAPDAGACGCSYGFHQECAADEICSGARDEAPLCVRAEPRGGVAGGGCSGTSTNGAAAPCNAQCVTSEPAASPCEGMGDGIEVAIGNWLGAINTATYISGSATEWEPMRAEDIEVARGVVTLSRECIDFLGWTVLGTIELCRGADTVRHGEPWDRIENRLFKVMTRPEDDCQVIAGNLCVHALEDGVSSGTVTANRLDNVLDDCPNGLPYASPCDGPSGHECVKERLRTIIRALDRRSR